MSILGVLTVITAFIINTYPVAIAVGMIGHALQSSRWLWLRRTGLLLEGIGMDWRRIAEAFRKDAGK